MYNLYLKREGRTICTLCLINITFKVLPVVSDLWQVCNNFQIFLDSHLHVHVKNVTNLGHSMMKKKPFKSVFQNDFFYFLDLYESKTILLAFIVGNLITLSLEFIKEVGSLHTWKHVFRCQL